MRKFFNLTSVRCPRFFQPILSDSSTTFKKVIITTVLATTISIGSVYADNGLNDKTVSTIYHVYIDNQRVGTVSNKSIIDKVVKEKIEKAENNYSHVSFSPADQLTYLPELVFNPVYNNSEALESVTKKLFVLADSVGIAIDGKTIAYVATKQEAEQVISSFKGKYVSQEVLQRVEDPDFKKQEPDLGEATIVDVKLSGKVTYVDEKTYPKNILSVEKAIELIQKGTLEPKTYVVQEGDVLGKIANKFDLTTKDLLEINSSITEDTLLQIGDELIVMDYKPLAKVVVEEKVYREELIPFETEIIEDDKMYKGDTKVKQEGSKGKKNSLYYIIKENGNTISKQLIKEEIKKEVKNKIVLKGTKVIPSRGTGNLTWPTVGGNITSSMGYRWGRLHKGIDIAGVSNKTIKAADNGVVSFAGWDGDYGNKVVIDHNNGMETIYAHLSKISVKNGQTVESGKSLGKMGSTGRSTGTHLHFEVHKNGKVMNPKSFY